MLASGSGDILLERLCGVEKQEGPVGGPARGAALSFIVNTVFDTKRSRMLSEGINRNLLTIIVVYLSYARLSYITIISYFLPENLSKIVRLAVLGRATTEGPEQLRLSCLIMGQTKILMSERYFPPTSQRDIRCIGWRSVILYFAPRNLGNKATVLGTDERGAKEMMSATWDSPEDYPTDCEFRSCCRLRGAVGPNQAAFGWFTSLNRVLWDITKWGTADHNMTLSIADKSISRRQHRRKRLVRNWYDRVMSCPNDSVDIPLFTVA